ncbi:hypothetical protein ABDK10_13710, partial [Staphylococcus aureus]
AGRESTVRGAFFYWQMRLRIVVASGVPRYKRVRRICTRETLINEPVVGITDETDCNFQIAEGM